MGRPSTREKKLKDGFYIEVRNKGARSGIKLRRESLEEMKEAVESYSRSKDIVLLGESKNGKWVDKEKAKKKAKDAARAKKEKAKKEKMAADKLKKEAAKAEREKLKAEAKLAKEKEKKAIAEAKAKAKEEAKAK